MKRNIIIFVATLTILQLCCLVAYLFIEKNPQFQRMASSLKQAVSAANTAGDATENIATQDWIPFIVDESSDSSPLSGFLYTPKEVESASARKTAVSASSSGKNTEGIREKVPDFPFEKIPLLKPAMVLSAEQHPFEENISMGVMFYTEASFQDTLEYY